MSIRPYRDIVRRKSRRVMVGSVPGGGNAPITVQTMTNTLTADADATTNGMTVILRPFLSWPSMALKRRARRSLL